MDEHDIQSEGKDKKINKHHTFDEDTRYIDTHDSTDIHGKPKK